MYNATVFQINEKGEDWGVFVSEVEVIEGKLQMLRSSFIQCTGYEGKYATENETGKRVAMYDYYLRKLYPGHTFTIILDNCQAYLKRLSLTDLQFIQRL